MMADEQEISEIGPGLLSDLADEESVRKLIECPVCLEIPLPPIYLCAKGHIVCNSCQSRTYACPLCREVYCGARSFVAEGIVEKCRLHCRYVDSGCKLMMKGSELVEHLPICEYRPVKCNECGNKLIQYSEYEDHLIKEHNLRGVPKKDEIYVSYRINLKLITSTNLHNCSWPLYYIKCFEKMFFLRTNASNSCMHSWICLFGPKQECDQYTVTIEFEPISIGSNGIRQQIVHSWKGPVTHFREQPNDAIDQGRTLCIPMKTISVSGSVHGRHVDWLIHIVLQKKCLDAEPEETGAASCPSSPESCYKIADQLINFGQDEMSNSVTWEQFMTMIDDDLNEEDKPSTPGGEDDQDQTISAASSWPSSCDEDDDTFSPLHHEQFSNYRSEEASNEDEGNNHPCTSSSMSTPMSSRNMNGFHGVASSSRKPKYSIQPYIPKAKENEETMESAGDQGDIDDYSDIEW